MNGEIIVTVTERNIKFPEKATKKQRFANIFMNINFLTELDRKKMKPFSVLLT